MASIQQIIAEIQLATDLPPGHIAKAIQIIRDAENRLKLKSQNSKPRKVSNGKNLVTLEIWEQEGGWQRTAKSIKDWVERYGLCPKMTEEMLDEFRREMISKGKQYANFAMAFQTYLRKGYLSKNMFACMLERSPYTNKTILDKRGVTL